MLARKPLIDAVVDDMAAVYMSLQELNMPVWLRLDLTMAQFRALVVVSHHRDITVGALGCQLSICQSTASLLVDQLVRRGLVTRAEDPADRRRALLGCTPAGEAMLSELRQGNQQTLKEWLAELNAEELEGIARGLHVLAQAARAPVSGAATIAQEANL
jgi:DNA-binding MarR family transcriptional regulator